MAVDQLPPNNVKAAQPNQPNPLKEDDSLAGQLPPKRASARTLIKRHRAHLQAQAAQAPPTATATATGAASGAGNGVSNGASSPAPPASMGSIDDPRPVKQVLIAEAYPASARSIRDLALVRLADLRVETHHRGQGLVVQAVTPAYRGVGAVSVVVDRHGSADKLASYHHSDTSLQSNLPEGYVVAVKEPYYKHNGTPHDYMICVDHPSDVVLLRFDDPLVPPELRPSAATPAGAALLARLRQTPQQWQAAGDAAFLRRDFAAAAHCYTEALETAAAAAEADAEADADGAPPPTFAAGVHAKRAGVNLLLGRYDGARDDALASCTTGSSSPGADWRAYVTAAKATYGLCRYAESRGYFEQALAAHRIATSSAAPPAALQRAHARCLARLREERDGGTEAVFDFPGMYAGLSLATHQVHLDRASFLRRTAVRRSAFHGNGLFATEAMRPGDIVFVEKATFMPSQYFDGARASAALYATMVRQMCDNPSVAAEVLQPLYGGDLARSGREGTLVDGVAVVDVFLAESIRLKNCFSAPVATLDDTRPARLDTAVQMAKGLWKHASYLNHSCVPNTMRSFLGDVLISRAVRPIAAGDELFQQYVPVKADLRARRAELQAGWGFVCACPLCTGEAAAGADGHGQRRGLLAAAEKLAAKHAPQRFPPDAAVRTIERLVRQLEASYDAAQPPHVYGAGRPRLGLVYPTMWLLRAHRCRRHHAKVVDYAARTLRCFGFRAPTAGADGTDGTRRDAMFSAPGAHPLHTIHVVSTLVHGAEAHRALGREDEAAAFEAAARLGYRIVTGFSEDLDAIREDK